MKLSLMWLREHLDYPQGHDAFINHAEDIVHRLIRSTAEIEHVERLSIDLNNLFLGRCESSLTGNALFTIPELSRTIELPARPDILSTSHDRWYMIYRESSDTYRYATMADITYKRVDTAARSSTTLKDSVLPAFYVSEHEAAGSWKQRCDIQDVRITIDNKSINHRPDLWSHYGFAREVAVIMGWKLKDLPQVPFTTIPADSAVLTVQSPACDRFACLNLTMAQKGSIPWMALRLSRVEQKPLSALVDATNYVMFDIGQPLHAFDADRIHNPLIIRQAYEGEKLTLLDNTTLSLQPFDCIVADKEHALSLAGIKGGKASALCPTTTNITLESAHFSPSALRQSSGYHHIRTESSTRFEKGLDRENVVPGITRFLSLIFCERLISEQPYSIMIWDRAQDRIAPAIELTIDHLAHKIGMAISGAEIEAILSSLGFAVSLAGTNEHRRYQVHVPSWRMHDIHIPEDLIEEIARIRGYDSLVPALPQRPMRFDTYNKKVLKARSIRHHVAYGLRMQEVMSYPFFDESFLHKTQLTITKAPTVRNPVSEQWRQLATSLIPNLVSQLIENLPEEKEVRLFEIAATWEHVGTTVNERRSIAWIWYTHKELDFYAGKQMVISLLEMLRIPHVWDVPSEKVHSWWQQSQAAIIRHGQQTIGYAGMLNTSFLAHVLQGSCFGVELDFDFLQNYAPEVVTYTPPSKYPTIVTDISMLVSYAIPVEKVMETIRSLDDHIMHVSLVDFFEKKAWINQRSVTIRIVCGDQSRTMTHEEVNAIIARVTVLLQEQFKVEIR